MNDPRRCNVKWNVKFEGDFLKICKGEDDKALGCSYEYFLALDKVEALKAENERLVAVLEKIADPRKRDHREPDTYTELGCVMHMASEALEAIKARSAHPPG